ncbi:MAG: hypothetical protein JSS02_03640 [Planctomycetes bacterium]|nr:hypothetical protein [Planctomycetota bacterium]
MTPTWAVCVPRDAARAVAGLRLERGIEVLELPDALWLRGDSLDEALSRRLWCLPGGRRFEVGGRGELRPLNSRLPQGQLPSGTWIAIGDWAQVELPPAAFAGISSERAALTLVRQPGEHDANVLLLPWSVWAAYGLSAAKVRLDRLRFVLSDAGTVVVHGEPLPPLPGERFYEQAGIALPCGWGWSPAIEPELLAKAWRLKSQDLALVATDGSWQKIPAANFVRAARSAIRETTPTT